MTDHPPAIPAIQVRQRLGVVAQASGTMAMTFAGSTMTGEWTCWTPIGLSPEQPARCGGTET